MAYVPTLIVSDLQGQVKTAYSSQFYVSPTVAAAKQLAMRVDPTFDILSSVGGQSKSASDKMRDQNGGGNGNKARTALIVVGVLAGVALLLFAAYKYRSNKQNQKKAELKRNTRAGTIRSFGGVGSLRETWAPNQVEEDRVMNGQLAETWSHHGGYQQGYHQEDPVMRSTSSNENHSIYGDPFIDAYGGVTRNRASRETERSSNSGNSNSLNGSSQGHSGGSASASVLSAMTEAQRIQYEYEESHGGFALGGSPTAMANFAMVDSSSDYDGYQNEYDQPQQYTTSHSYGAPPPTSSNGNRQRKRGSVASSTIGRPEMKSNSMLF